MYNQINIELKQAHFCIQVQQRLLMLIAETWYFIWIIDIT